jgi:very-short-patch-repair endonuclease
LHGFKFRRQHPLGNFIVDFVCLEKGLVVELNGGQHAVQGEHDSGRDEWLQGEGFRVLRFWNTQVFKEMDAVLERMGRALLME